ncbi:MAG: PVC-type heme-binding CxxCH protein, partial [Chitinophagaceae bacterium]
TGFFNKNEEAQISNLRFGVDNWIYANNNGQAGEITFTRVPNAPKLQVRGSDFRFRLDRNQFEVTTGRGQFGLALDDWNHRFFTQNSLHIQQAVIPKRYLQRNPNLPVDSKTPIVNNSDHDPLMFQLTDAPYWRQERTNQRNKKFQENHLPQVEYARGHFTGSSGGTYYGGDLFAKEFYGNIFTGDVAGNLVHRDVLLTVDTAPYLVAQRPPMEKDKEFMASTDSWFRPASLTSGPNGELYVIDMYRQHIETPMSIPEDLQVGMDFNAGNKDGRIYRIVPGYAPAYKKAAPDLRSAKSSVLVPLLSHQNSWWRMQAQRLLLERQDKTVIPQVKTLFAETRDPRTKLHALYVLEGMDALDPGLVKTAMLDSSAGLRENAALLAERFPELLAELEKMTEDASMSVALQASLSVGEFNDKSVVVTLSRVVNRYGSNPWFRTAVLSSKAGSSVSLVKMLKQDKFFNVAAPWKLIFMQDLAEVIATRNHPGEIGTMQQLIALAATGRAGDWKAALALGFARADNNHHLKTTIARIQ